MWDLNWDLCSQNSHGDSDEQVLQCQCLVVCHVQRYLLNLNGKKEQQHCTKLMNDYKERMGSKNIWWQGMCDARHLVSGQGFDTCICSQWPEVHQLQWISLGGLLLQGCDTSICGSWPERCFHEEAWAPPWHCSPVVHAHILPSFIGWLFIGMILVCCPPSSLCPPMPWEDLLSLVSSTPPCLGWWRAVISWKTFWVIVVGNELPSILQMVVSRRVSFLSIILFTIIVPWEWWSRPCLVALFSWILHLCL